VHNGSNATLDLILYIFLATILHTDYLTPTCCTMLLLIIAPKCTHQKTYVLPEGGRNMAEQ